MNKYKNNFSRSSGGDSPMRFNKRPRYSANNLNNTTSFGGSISGSSNNLRPKHQNISSYQQYTQNRNSPNNAVETVQHQYENSSRNFYGISPNRTNHNHHIAQNKQASPYLRKSMTSSLSSGLSPSPSAASSSSATAFLSATQNVLNLPPTQAESAITIHQTLAQNHHNQQSSSVMDNSNYHNFSYNSFYVNNYTPDLMSSVSSSSFGVIGGDGMSSYMWQTIKTTPPPKLSQPPPPTSKPQQRSLPPPPPLPPLPPQQPPPPQVPPPLPATDISTSQLPQTPNQTTTISTPSNLGNSSRENEEEPNKTDDQETGSKTVVKMKAKRKAISTRYKLCRNWSEEDALLALKAEETNVRKLQKDTILIVRFPDPEINRDIVKCYSPDIESVHFQLNFAPRYCLVHLKPGADVEKTIDTLSKIPFGTGFLSVEIKQIPHKLHSTKLKEIDPYTLYVGNLPTTIACKTLKEHFPGAARIDIGFAQRMKYTRYAFVRYQNVQNAIEAYKRMLDAEIGGRNLTVRFRRVTPMDKDKDDTCEDNDAEHLDDVHDDILCQTVENMVDCSEEIVKGKTKKLSEECEKNTSDLGKRNASTEDRRTETNSYTPTVPSHETGTETQENIPASTSSSSEPTETNSCAPTVSNSQQIGTRVQDTNNLPPMLNIKPDPDIDPDDIVIRDNAITSRFQVNANESIKQEEEEAMYMEFYAPPQNQTETTTTTTNNNDAASLPASSTDDNDSMSNLSSNSLGEFLQNCQRTQQTQNTRHLETSTTKRTKLVNSSSLEETIKKEPLENGENLSQLGQEATLMAVKQEPKEIPEIGQGNTNDKMTSERQTVPRRNVNEQTSSFNKSSSVNDTADDLVPPTALFFKNPNKNNIETNDYDEFYETSINSQTTTTTNIKREPFDINLNEHNNTNNISLINQDTNINLINLLNRTTTMSTNSLQNNDNDDDDDDLVPSQNLLGSYCPLRNDIKREKEHDDLFDVPFNKTNENGDDDRSTAITNRNELIKENSRSKNQLIESDDDVIIISDNISSSQSHQKPSNTLVLGNLFFRKQPDLVTLKPQTLTTTTFTKRENSKLILHHDNLDKLYEQLDADSDNDL
ncbi:RNA binding domain-containing protein painting of fourth [Cochliomyia hominivorax]